MKQAAIGVCKALADETRLEIVRLLTTRREMSCQSLSKKLPRTQPTLSHHFNKLVNANIIIARKAGVHHYYSVNTTYLKRLGINIGQLTAGNR